MYEYIKGTYEGMTKDYIVIENNGIGYKVFTSGSTLAKTPKIGEEILLYLQQVVREDFIGLYGFLTKDELNMFKLLLTINGVGAKAALSLLSISNVTNLKYAIFSGDEKTITKAPGIGKKMAQRIILELKDKVKTEEIVNTDNINIGIQENTEAAFEALEALIALGYSEKEAQKAINSIDNKDSLENIIKNALKFLMS
ncbi:Holliday junction branch migration protein RuvA [Clostridium sp. DJ247]|uniref:Holliday junction branch migration protein RuvA n=1 Tax=Clostridium sp. DJ247 TaxID=2726188 RepID=UPI00162A1840|nr:Holliday junction branch migration protein RuvA [Clostridium sp. DJ247]MBC2581154.1 Holliday junction branch migration protein RuvA [Clostridium sp. DJ247]